MTTETVWFILATLGYTFALIVWAAWRRNRDYAARLHRLLLLEPEHWWYALDLLAILGGDGGVLYPALSKLERAGLVEARWETPPPSDRRPRRAYRVARHARQVQA